MSAVDLTTNITSLMTQNNLNAASTAESTSIQQLSSGYQINSAADNAAGLAIATRLTSQINGLTQAQSNANNGISMTQTTLSALSQVTNNLQSIRNLTVQAANGTNSASDLTSIQDAISQSLNEIDRTSQQTQFNGLSVMGQGASTTNIQVGANDGQSISIGLQQIDSATLGLTGFNVGGGTANTASTVTDLTSAGYAKSGAAVNGTQAYTKAYGASSDASLSNVLAKTVSGDTVTDQGLTYTSTGTNYTYSNAADSVANVSSALTPAAGGSTTATIKINGSSTQVNINSNGDLTSSTDGNKLYLDATGNLTENDSAGGAQANVNGAGSATLAAASAAGDVLASLGGIAGGTGGTITVGTGATPATYTFVGNTATANATNLQISSAALATQTNADDAAGHAISVTTGGQTYAVAATTGVVTDGTQVFNDMNGNLTTSASSTLYAHANGAVTDNSANTVYDSSASAGTFTMSATTGSTATTNPLAAIDAALAMVSSLSSSLGAVQDRLTSAIATDQATSTNLTSSKAGIMDTNYAQAASSMTDEQNVVQAGDAVLKQANNQAQGVLSLLQG